MTAAKILIVDDEPANVRLLERLLQSAGYTELEQATDPRRVLTLYETFRPDLILLDLLMPHLDGIAVLAQLRSAIPEGVYVPVLVLTADATLEAKQRALAAGANDFLTKPFEQFEVVLRIRNLLDTRRLYLELERQNRLLEATVRERTERLLQSEKVAAMGSLLAGVAHELNNPLAVVLGQSHLLRESAPDARTLARAQKISAGADRCGRIVRNFLALARQRAPERGEVRLNQVVDEALELLAYELRTDNVEVALDLAEGLPVLWADGHQLHQVLVNMVANAHHAMRHGRAQRRLAITTRFDPGSRHVRLALADTGPGIPAEIRAKIFEAFFTTKPPGQGTGLGLSLCQGIVAEHGGTIAVESEPGRGATFTITLPVLPRPATVAAPPDEEPSTPADARTILVVDDEPEIAAILLETLERDGHRAESVANGAEALQRLERQEYDLIVSDTKMPVLDGVDFYHELERRFPALLRRIVFVTGDVLDVEKQRFLESIGAPIVTKPFDLGDVRRVVRAKLADARRR
jgi:signal transduction histidine kinase